MKKVGIDETRDIVKAFVELANAIDSITQDGFQLSDIFELVKPLSLIPAAVTGSEQVPGELFDLDDDERKIIYEDIEKLEFESDYSEVIGEQALKTVMEFALLITVIDMAKNRESVQRIWEMIRKMVNA